MGFETVQLALERGASFCVDMRKGESGMKMLLYLGILWK